LRDLEAEWNALLAAAARDIHIFQSFNWIWHWANQFLPAGNDHEGDCGLYIITGRRNGPLAVLHPFVCHCRAGLTTLSFAGETVSQYGDILIDPANGGPEMLDRVWAYAIENASGDVVALRKVRADANIVYVLERQQAVVTERQVAPYLDLATAPDYEFYEKRYSWKTRKNRRRLLRRFEERAPTEVHELSSGQRAGELAALAVSLKRAWVKHRGLVSRALSNPATRNFFASVATAADRLVGAIVTSLNTRRGSCSRSRVRLQGPPRRSYNRLCAEVRARQCWTALDRAERAHGNARWSRHLRHVVTGRCL
jgi:CelD/BcsL family acetyltransferase involved in cellulose biosynthesis